MFFWNTCLLFLMGQNLVIYGPFTFSPFLPILYCFGLGLYGKKKQHIWCTSMRKLIPNIIFETCRFTVGLVMLFKGENGNKHCSWCHYLSCVPTSRWHCDNWWTSATFLSFSFLVIFPSLILFLLSIIIS